MAVGGYRLQTRKISQLGEYYHSNNLRLKMEMEIKKKKKEWC